MAAPDKDPAERERERVSEGDREIKEKGRERQRKREIEAQIKENHYGSVNLSRHHMTETLAATPTRSGDRKY